MSVSIIVPTFKAAESLGFLVERISSTLSAQSIPFEVILVDDGSPDNSWDVITALAMRYPWLAGVRLAQNIGQYAATLTGLHYARHPVAITMDDDLQHPPEAIPALLAALTPGTDIVYAAPALSWPPSSYRMLVAAVKFIVAFACGAPFLRHIRSFRALRTAIYPWSSLSIHRALSPDSLLKPLKPKVRTVRVPYGRRLTGQSNYNLKRSAELLLMIFRSSRKGYSSQHTAPPPIVATAGWLTHPGKETDALIARQKDHFDAIAAHYQKSRRHPNHAALKALIWQEFFRHVPAWPEGQHLRVLEAMCGFADGNAILAAHGKHPFTYTGFDYSDTVIDALRREQPGLHVYKQDAARFETREQYDLVMLLGGLHHVPHEAATMVRALAQALAPGGYFISLEPTDGNPLFRRLRKWIYRHNALFDTQTERAFTVPELSGLFEQAGLQQQYICHPGLLAYVLYYNPDAFPWLNIGGPGMVRAAWSLDRQLLHSAVGRYLSFATLSLWRKP